MKERRGLTLIEVVLSMALIGMVAIVFLTVFNIGNKNIFKAGERTDNTLEIQRTIDGLIKEYEEESDFDDEADSEGGSDDIIKGSINVKIEGFEGITVDGKLITKEENGINITTFVPDLLLGKEEDLDEK